MYLVKNVTQRVISLRDLRVTINPDEQVDLDLVVSPVDISNSETLKYELNKQSLQRITNSHVSLDHVAAGTNPVHVDQKRNKPVKPDMTMDELMNSLRKDLNNAVINTEDPKPVIVNPIAGPASTPTETDPGRIKFKPGILSQNS